MPFADIAFLFCCLSSLEVVKFWLPHKFTERWIAHRFGEKSCAFVSVLVKATETFASLWHQGNMVRVRPVTSRVPTFAGRGGQGLKGPSACSPGVSAPASQTIQFSLLQSPRPPTHCVGTLPELISAMDLSSPLIRASAQNQRVEVQTVVAWRALASTDEKKARNHPNVHAARCVNLDSAGGNSIRRDGFLTRKNNLLCATECP